MISSSAFAVAGKIAGLGGLSIALAYVILRPLIVDRILKTLNPTDRARVLRLTVRCALTTSVAGLAVYAFSIWVQQPNIIQQPSLTVGHNATIGGNAALSGPTQIKNDLAVGKDLSLGTGQNTKDGD